MATDRKSPAGTPGEPGRPVYVLRSDGRWVLRRLRGEGAVEVFGLDRPEVPVVAEVADPAEELRQLRRAMQETHPDRGGDPEHFQRVRRAFEAAKGKSEEGKEP